MTCEREIVFADAVEIQSLGEGLRRDLMQAHVAVEAACRSINSVLLGTTGNIAELARSIGEVNGMIASTILEPDQRQFSDDVTQWISELEMLVCNVPLMPPIATPPDPGPGAEASNSLRVLVAEDNRINQELAIACLESDGHRVDIARNGLEAVEAVRTFTYDAVLMDYDMPELDGIEATAQIRALPGINRAVPIIAMTASAAAGDQARWAKAGMDQYLPKPYAPAALLSTLKHVCHRRRVVGD